ncbi:MAG TPA: hypothetical protein VH917_00445, partial [Ignavibacteriaceae bacterium]
MDLNTFPRNLTSSEKKILFSVLPESKAGYKLCLEKISDIVVIGSGRFGGGNFILGNPGSIPDLSISSSPVFALGSLVCSGFSIDVVIHEEQDSQIEYDISSSVKDIQLIDFGIDEVRSFSLWNPGDNKIFGDNIVRQYDIVESEYILAVSPGLKKIWLHNYSTGVNHIIPLTNFFNELMRLKNVRNPEVALSPYNFFAELDSYSAEEIKSAFLLY